MTPHGRAPRLGQAFLARAIRQAQGREAADLVLKGGRVFNLVTGEVQKGDIAICGDRIVGIGTDYRAVREIDVGGKVVAPGFIDTHCHVESSLLTPRSSSAACCRMA